MENIMMNGNVVSFDGFSSKDKTNKFHYSFNVITGETIEDTGADKFSLSEAKFRLLWVLSEKKELPNSLKANTH